VDDLLLDVWSWQDLRETEDRKKHVGPPVGCLPWLRVKSFFRSPHFGGDVSYLISGRAEGWRSEHLKMLGVTDKRGVVHVVHDQILTRLAWFGKPISHAEEPCQS